MTTEPRLDPRRVVVSFAGENHGAWIDRMERLALTLQDLRTSIGIPPPIAVVIDGVSDEDRTSLEQLGCDVRTAPAVDAEQRFMNKLRMLELPEIERSDGIFMLDCDLVVLGDPLPAIAPGAINAFVEQGTNLSDDLWRRVYSALGLGELRRTYRDELSGALRYPYFNTGVLWIPTPIVDELAREWYRACRELIELSADVPELRARIGMVDQIAFAVAIVRMDHAVHPLPLALNCPTGGFRWRARPTLAPRPLILHYHDNVDRDGFLRVPNHPVLRSQLDAINRRWAAYRDTPYRRPRRQRIKKRMIRESRTTKRLLQRASRVRRALRS